VKSQYRINLSSDHDHFIAFRVCNYSFVFHFKDSLIDMVGIVYLDFPTLILIPLIMASVRGSFMEIVVPLSGTLSTKIVPPTMEMLLLTISIPTPRPENSVTFSFVESPE